LKPFGRSKEQHFGAYVVINYSCVFLNVSANGGVGAKEQILKQVKSMHGNIVSRVRGRRK
jgi:hypothetical protein